MSISRVLLVAGALFVSSPFVVDGESNACFVMDTSRLVKSPYSSASKCCCDSRFAPDRRRLQYVVKEPSSLLRVHQLAGSNRIRSRSGILSAQACDEVCASETVLKNLLTQRALQTHLHYQTSLRNELATRWAEGFLDHQHLALRRVSDYEVIVPYHGCDGLRVTWDEYLGGMLAAPPVEYSVRYKVGTADTGWWPAGGAAAAVDAAGQPAPWAAASESRRANPYLAAAAEYREYTEVLRPDRVVQALMAIREELAHEWISDLSQTPADNQRILRYAAAAAAAASAASAAATDGRSAPPGAAQSAAAAAGLGSAASPAAVAAAWAAADSGAAGPATGGGFGPGDAWGESSPLRGPNRDLVQRLLTQVAALDVLAGLSRGPGRLAQYQWLKSFLGGERLARFAGPQPVGTGEAVLLELLAQPMAASPGLAAAAAAGGAADGGGAGAGGGEGGWNEALGLVNPEEIGRAILDRRARLAEEWARVLRRTAEDHAGLLRRHLTRTVGAPPPPPPGQEPPTGEAGS